MADLRAQWEEPAVLDVGDLESVVQVSVGGGKTVITEGDPGEEMKVPGGDSG